MTKVDLLVAPCSHKAAKFAVMNWHYSQAMPAGKIFKVGVWENGNFVGCVLFSLGANRNIAKPYGLLQTEVCELVRVAMTKHKTEVSKIIKISFSLLKKKSPNIKLVVSYADQNQGHVGKIYQAGNWIYEGETGASTAVLLPSGEVLHKKTVFSRYGTNDTKKLNASLVTTLPKHKYIFPLDKETRSMAEQRAKPYPK